MSSGALSAGCEVGRFFLSIWRLVYFDTEERAWHLKNHFGVGFFSMAWRPHPLWPLFHALSRLHERVLGDPAGTYPHVRCDSLSSNAANAEMGRLLLVELTAGLHSAATPGLAAHFLFSSNQSSTCPLAIAGAFWSLALSLSKANSSAVEEVMSLVERGEEAAKAWEPDRLPFLDLFTTQWPLWDLLARVEQLTRARDVPSLGESVSPQMPAPSPLPQMPTPSHPSRAQRHLDPLEPVCAHSDQSVLVHGLEEQRVEAIVVYGRRERVQILHRYLQRNLRVNGGLLDRVSFVVFAAMNDDLIFLQQLVESHAPFYHIPPVTGRRLAKIYSICNDPETVYIKIDDDIVYIADEAIPAMVRERRRGRCGIVSANVVNHAILSAVHQDIGAIRSFFPPAPAEAAEAGGGGRGGAGPPTAGAWVRVDDVLPLSAITKHAQSDCVWKLWECGAWMHESFLSRLADGTECAYDFGWHDFHAHGHGAYRGDRFVPLAYTRWSINMIALKAEDLTEASLADLAEDDESELAVMVHHRMGKRACAIGQALVAHFSYSRQEDGLLENTDLLLRYDNISVALVSGPS